MTQRFGEFLALGAVGTRQGRNLAECPPQEPCRGPNEFQIAGEGRNIAHSPVGEEQSSWDPHSSSPDNHSVFEESWEKFDYKAITTI
jgi:hypothetical protein